MSKTIQEVADEYITCDCGEVYKSRDMVAPDCARHSSACEEAMEAWGKQQAIAFAEWVEDNAMKYKNGWLYKHGEQKLITAEQIYNLFITQTTSKIE